MAENIINNIKLLPSTAEINPVVKDMSGDVGFDLRRLKFFNY